MVLDSILRALSRRAPAGTNLLTVVRPAISQRTHGSRLPAFADVRQRLAYESRRDAKALGDKRVTRGSQCRDPSPLSRFDEHSECAADGETAFSYHLPAYSFVNENEIGPKRFGDEEDSGGLSAIKSEANSIDGSSTTLRHAA